jgi:formyltetrahydrofolate-dependent phosphoribosylglycinamide formyltransferase
VSRRAVFVDRDGTVIADPGYLDHPNGVRLLPGAGEAIARLNRAGYSVIMITNQSGIGRGYYSEDAFRDVQREVERQLGARGAHIDGVYFCPHDPTVHACECRKPGVLLFEQAIAEHDLDGSASWFVGDRGRDVAPAARWDGRAVQVARPDGSFDEGPEEAAHVDDLAAAVDLILGGASTSTVGASTRGAPLRVAVLVSGGGTNLQALIDRFAADPSVEICGVIGSREGIGALDRAEAAGIPSAVHEARGEDEAAALTELLRGFGAELVVLAGYMRLVPAPVVAEWRGRMLNIHPALLPDFGGEGMYGRRVHEAVLAAGVSETGVTIHLVDEAYDRGPIVAQRRVPVKPGDDAERLAARVLQTEHELLPDVVAAVAAGRCRLSPEGAEWSRTQTPETDDEAPEHTSRTGD